MKTYKEFITEVKKSTIEKNRKTIEKRKQVDSKYIDSEKGEFDRYSDGKEMMKNAKKSSIRNLSSKETENLQNTDASEIKPGAQGRRNARRLAKKYGRNIDRVINQVKSKTDQPSIVKTNSDGTKELVGGNTRAMVRRSLGRPVRVIEIK